MAIFTAIGTAVATTVLGAAAVGGAGFTFLSKRTARLLRTPKERTNERR